MDVKNEAGAIAKVSSLFASQNISIEALIQKDSRQNNDEQHYVPVIIISGPMSDIKSVEMKESLECVDEITNSAKQYRIHNAL